MSIIVREIKQEDIEDVAEVIRTAGMGSGDQVRSWIEKMKEGEHIFVAEKDGKIISCVAAILRHPPYGFIPTVATHSDYRKIGAETKTLQAALDKAKESGFSLVGLFTGNDNIAGQRLYKKLGFVPVHPEWTYLLNPLSIQLVDELRAKRPFLEPRLEESFVKVEQIDCACLKWYDVISKEQIVFCFNPIHEWYQDNSLLAFNLMKLEVNSSSLKMNFSIQSHAANFNLCQDSEGSVGVSVENRSENEFEYQLKIELPSCLRTEDKLDEIQAKIAPRGKTSHKINVLVPADAQVGIAPIQFEVNDAMPVAATLWIRNMVEFDLTPKNLTLAPGANGQILVHLKGNHPKPSEVEYELSYPEDFSLEPLKWKMSDFKQDNQLLLQQSISAPTEAKNGSYELTGKVFCREREFTSTIKLRVTDFPRILLLSKDEETEPFIDAILSEPENGLTWLTLPEVTNLNWSDSLRQYHLLILDELQRPRPLSQNQMWNIYHYVENGGGFLMFGGWDTCQGHDAENCGFYKGTPIEKIIPVE